MFHKNERETGNGIEFTRRNRITLNNKILISPRLKLLQFMLVAAGVYGTLFSLISGLNIPVYTSVLFAAGLLSSLYFLTSFLVPGLLKYSMPLTLVIYLAAAYLFWDEIKNGFWHVENIYIDKFNAYYETSILKYLVDDYPEKAVNTIFFIFVTIILCQLICSLILRNSFRIIFGIVTVAFVLLPFTVGYVPSSLPFGVYLAFVISIIGMAATLREKHRHFNIISLHEKQKADDKLLEQNFKYVIGLKIGGFLASLLLLLIMCTSIIITPDFYSGKIKITDTKEKIQKEMMDFNLEEAVNNISSLHFDGMELFQGITASGGLSGGKLGRIGEVNFNYHTALKLKTAATDNSIYLKGYVGSEYKGDYWDELSKADKKKYDKIADLWKGTDFTIGNQSSYFLSQIKFAGNDAYSDFEYYINDMEVEGINSNPDYIYAPYYSVYAPRTLMDVSNPEYVNPKKKQNTYELNYYSGLNNALQFDEEKEYANYYNKYLQRIRDIDDKDLPENLREMEEYRRFEKAYREFVYDTYTRVPDTGLERIKEQFGSIHYNDYKRQYGSQALENLVQLVKSDLSTTTSYSLAPGILPKGKDFVEYFLYENKTGYCSHYASAAVMILRTMGVPARYVEGYIVKTKDISQGKVTGTVGLMEHKRGMFLEKQVDEKTIEISDANAHAWVEVYVDGFGWAPVEVTPGFSGTSDSNDTADTMNNQQQGKNSVTPKIPTPTKAGDADENDLKDGTKDSAENESKDKSKNNSKDTAKPTKTPAPDGEKDADSGGSKVSGTGTTDLKDKGVISYLEKLAWILLWILSLAGITIMFLLVRAFLILKKREKAQKTTDFSKRVLLRYNEIGRMMEYYQIGIPENTTFNEAAAQVEKQWKHIKEGRYKRFTDIVLKARFNQYCISREESEEAEEFYKELIHSVYENTSPFKRIILRFIKVFR